MPTATVFEHSEYLLWSRLTLTPDLIFYIFPDCLELYSPWIFKAKSISVHSCGSASCHAFPEWGGHITLHRTDRQWYRAGHFLPSTSTLLCISNISVFHRKLDSIHFPNQAELCMVIEITFSLIAPERWTPKYMDIKKGTNKPHPTSTRLTRKAHFIFYPSMEGKFYHFLLM